MGVLGGVSVVSAASPELRGTWVTTTGLASGNIRTPAVTNTNFARLRSIGLNTVYQDVWRNGQSYFQSNTLAAITGRTLATDAGGRDILDETIIAAHRNGMQNIAWLQYGFAAQFIGTSGSPSNSLATYMNSRGWLLKDQSGNVVNSSNSFAWMNPLVPEVRQLITGMAVEMVTKYDLDGVQFDDRLAWPTQFGYDDYTRNAYLAETGRNLPSNPTDSAFTLWRSQKITEFAREFSAALREANPNLIISAAPSTYPFGYDSYAANWPAWSRETIEVDGVTYPLFDEIIPQVYRSSASSFNNEWQSEISVMNPADLDSLAAGISINNSSGAPYDWNSVNGPQVAAQRNSAATRGHVWWYSSGVLDAREAEITQLYSVAVNGQADHPDRASDWRPAAEVGTRSGSQFSFDVGEMNRYTFVVESSGRWRTIWSDVVPAGPVVITQLGVTQGELLVDRRGFTIGDADLDNAVDFDDLITLARNFDTAVGQLGWKKGDFDLNGVVDFSDLIALARNFGTPAIRNSADFTADFDSAWATAQSLVVPEPAAMLGMLATCVTAVRPPRGGRSRRFRSPPPPSPGC